MITELELAQLEEAERKATKGPWYDCEGFITGGGTNYPAICKVNRNESDAAFISLSRNLMPKLIEEIRLLRAINRNPTAFPTAMDYAEHLERENSKLRTACEMGYRVKDEENAKLRELLEKARGLLSLSGDEYDRQVAKENRRGAEMSRHVELMLVVLLFLVGAVLFMEVVRVPN